MQNGAQGEHLAQYPWQGRAAGMPGAQGRRVGGCRGGEGEGEESCVGCRCRRYCCCCYGRLRLTGGGGLGCLVMSHSGSSRSRW